MSKAGVLMASSSLGGESAPKLPAEVLPKPSFETGRLKKSFSYSYLRRQECRPLKMTFKQRIDRAAEVAPPAPLAEREEGIDE
eukprot:1788490-Amphidinium_carterae.1